MLMVFFLQQLTQLSCASNMKEGCYDLEEESRAGAYRQKSVLAPISFFQKTNTV